MENIKWTKIIKNAIDSNNIVPFYQPIVNRDKKIVKYESLIRLIDENNKVISPLSFLEIAKKSKLYPSLTEIMVEKSCKTFSDKKMEFSLNLSYNDIVDDEMNQFRKSASQYFGGGTASVQDDSGGASKPKKKVVRRKKKEVEGGCG